MSTPQSAKTTSAKIKYKKAPQAPRRFKSAYMFYSTWKHRDIRENVYKHQTNIKTPEVAKMVSRAWNMLTPEEKAPWEEMARKDKARFQLEKSTYSGPWKVPDVKDPRAPKRPVSAFICFSKARRAQVKRSGTHMSTTQISSVLAQMWKEAPEMERQKYLSLDMKDRQRYRRELDEYNEIASQGRKKREELAFQAISNQPIFKEEDTVSDLSEEVLMQDLMNQPLMIDGQDLRELTKSCTDNSETESNAEDSLLEDVKLEDFEASGEKPQAPVPRARVEALPPRRVESFCLSPSPKPERSLTSTPDCDIGLSWEPIPFSEAPNEKDPSSPRNTFEEEDYHHHHPSVVTPPKLQMQPKELVNDKAVSMPFHQHTQQLDREGLSRSFSAPVHQQTPWYVDDPNLRPISGYGYDNYHDHRRVSSNSYDFGPLRSVSWESGPPSQYNATSSTYNNNPADRLSHDLEHQLQHHLSPSHGTSSYMHSPLHHHRTFTP